MGCALSSRINDIEPVNYNCPICQQTNKIPNRAGRFFIINENECKCNGCNTIFEKDTFFKSAKNS